MQRTRWPNFFIVGAARSGTTSLYEYLRRSPDIFLPEIKEPNYFAPNITPNQTAFISIQKEDEYLKLFQRADRRAVALGEASPSYLWDKDAPRRIHSVIPDAKIIVILRDPIERAFSHYLMCVQKGWEQLSFFDAVINDYNRFDKGYGLSNLYVELGFYHDSLVRYLNLFDRDQIRIIFFEEFISNTKEVVEQLLRFLGSKSRVPDNVSTAYNPHSYPIKKHQILRRFTKYLEDTSAKNINVNNMFRLVPQSIKDKVRTNILLQSTKETAMVPSEGAKQYLKEIYSQDVTNVRRLLKSDLPWKNFQI